MVVLGIVLIVLAVLFGLGVSVSSTDSATMSVFGVDFGVIVPTVFFLGAAAGIALMAGLWLMKKGLGRGYRRRKEMKELRQQAAAVDTTTEPDTVAAPESESTRELETAPDADGARETAPASEARRAADPDTPDEDRLATEQHTVADSTDTRQPH
jgi:cytoskeletal protein RodZ